MKLNYLLVVIIIVTYSHTSELVVRVNNYYHMKLNYLLVVIIIVTYSHTSELVAKKNIP